MSAYEEGRDAAHAWMRSPQFAQFDRSAPARDVARMFLPPVTEAMLQMASPLPERVSEWMRGFDDVRRELRDVPGSPQENTHD